MKSARAHQQLLLSLIALALLAQVHPTLGAIIWVHPSGFGDWTTADCTDPESPCGQSNSVLNVEESTTVNFHSGTYTNKFQFHLTSVSNGGTNNSPLTLNTSGVVDNLQVEVTSGDTANPVSGDVIVAGNYSVAIFSFTRLDSLTLRSANFEQVAMNTKAVATISLSQVDWIANAEISAFGGATSVPITIECSEFTDTLTDVTVRLAQVHAECNQRAGPPSDRNCTGFLHVLSATLEDYLTLEYIPSITINKNSGDTADFIDFSTFLYTDFTAPATDPIEWAQPVYYDLRAPFSFNHRSQSVVEVATITWDSTGPLRRPLFPLSHMTSVAQSSFNCEGCIIETLPETNLPLLGMSSGANWTSSASALSFTNAELKGVSMIISSPNVKLVLVGTDLIDCHISASSLLSISLRDTDFRTETLSSLQNPLSRAFCQIASPRSITIQNCQFIGGSTATLAPNLLLVNASISLSTALPSTSSQYYSNMPTMTVDRLAVGYSPSAGPAASASSTTLYGWNIVRQTVHCYLGNGDISSFQRYSATGSQNPLPCILAFGSDGSTSSTPRSIPLDNLLTLEGSVVFEDVQLASLRNLQYKLKSVSSSTGISFLHAMGALYAFTDTTAADSTGTVNSSSPAVSVVWADSASPPLAPPRINIPLYTYKGMTRHNPIPRVNAELSDLNFSISVQRLSTAGASSQQGMYFSTAEPLKCPEPRPQPTTSFTCQNGVWVSNSTDVTTGGTIVVAGPILIPGNFNISNITFIGMNTSIEVRGCANLPTTIFITLTPADILLLRNNKEYLATLISSRCNATSGYQGDIHVSTDRSNIKSCERVTGSVKADGSTLTGLFTLDSSKCSSNLWWIVLVSVLGGVILLITILALIFTQVPAARRCVRPYTVREEIKKAEVTGNVK